MFPMVHKWGPQTCLQMQNCLHCKHYPKHYPKLPHLGDPNMAAVMQPCESPPP